jgi:ATP-dependent exoDNAse (exonuclease V) beta subunit
MKNIRIIEAGAGSGKTYRLAEEVFHALTRTGKDRIRPEAFILTTFTRKASSELLSRVAQRLVNEGRRTEASLIRQSLIGTVNSVCDSLLKRFAFTANLPVRMTVMPEGDEQALYNLVLSSVIKPKETNRLSTLSRICYVDDWRKTVGDIAKSARVNCIASSDLKTWADQSVIAATDFLPEPAGNKTACLREVERSLTELDSIIASGTDTTKTTGGAADKLRDAIRKTGIGRTLTWQEYNSLGKISAGKRSGADDALYNVRSIASQHHTWPEFRESIGEYIHTVFDIAARSLDEYQSWKQSEDLIDFIDQEVMLLNLLDLPEVQKTLSEELDMVLVDEFQDTSPVQLALFLKLSECANESIWVGDPKQAIYGFRNADPDLMFAAVNSIYKKGGTKGGTADRLDTSYRSVEPLVQFINETFRDAFVSQGIPPERVGLDANRKGKTPGTALESWVIDTGNKTDMAASLAGQIKSVLEDPLQHAIIDKASGKERALQPGDIAVLARTNDDCNDIADALKGIDVPVERSTKGLMARPETVLACAGLKLLIDPNDSMAAAQVTYLTEVVLKEKPDEAWLRERLAEREKQAVLDARDPDKYGAWLEDDCIQQLRTRAETVKELTPCAALETVLHIAGVWDFAGSLPNPHKSFANINRLLSCAREYEESCLTGGISVTIAGMLQYFEQLESDEVDFTGISGANAVQVSTWHAAKGLEWPVVIVYSLETRSPDRLFEVNSFTQGDISMDNPVMNRGIRYILFPYSPNSRNTTEYGRLITSQPLSAEARKSADDEWTRLMYVLLTRARDRLIFATRPGKLNGLRINGTLLVDVPQDHTANPEVWRVVSVPAWEDVPDSSDRKSLWFPHSTVHTDRDSVKVNPSDIEMSAAEAKAVPTVIETFGTEVSVAGEVQVDTFGTALHQYLAVDFSQVDNDGRKEIAARIMNGHGFKEAVEPRDIVRCGNDIETWIAQKWPDAETHREWPVIVNDDGTLMEGFTDIVLIMKKTFVIVDYKSYLGQDDKIEMKAATYARQLEAYTKAVALATGKKCAGTYICFAMKGVAVNVQTGTS